MDTSLSQDSLLEDYLLTNRINIHRCSDYCLRQRGSRKEKTCRMEFWDIIITRQGIKEQTSHCQE